jgi:hypothetical protein
MTADDVRTVLLRVWGEQTCQVRAERLKRLGLAR